MSEALAHFFFAGGGEIFFGLVGQAFDDFVGILTGPSFLSPYGCSEADAVRVEFALYDSAVFPQLGVGVILDWVALGLVCLGCDANVNGDSAPVEYGVSDDVSWSESS